MSSFCCCCQYIVVCSHREVIELCLFQMNLSQRYLLTNVHIPIHIQTYGYFSN